MVAFITFASVICGFILMMQYIILFSMFLGASLEINGGIFYWKSFIWNLVPFVAPIRLLIYNVENPIPRIRAAFRQFKDR